MMAAQWHFIDDIDDITICYSDWLLLLLTSAGGTATDYDGIYLPFCLLQRVLVVKWYWCVIVTIVKTILCLRIANITALLFDDIIVDPILSSPVFCCTSSYCYWWWWWLGETHTYSEILVSMCIIIVIVSCRSDDDDMMLCDAIIDDDDDSSIDDDGIIGLWWWYCG